MTNVRLIERGAILLGKYRVDCLIGRGGMGLVVKAWHLGLEEEVAIKMLRDDIAVADESIVRFIREAQAAAKLKSEHIARIIDVGTFSEGKPYLVMEFLEGQDIGQLLAERGRLQPSLAIDLVIQACEGLAEAHSLGIIHRDIKPTNLFLTSRPDGSVLLKILDFGISKSPAGAELSLTQTWSLLGSPAYMSPEQMRSARHVDARTDVWSLGAVLYEALEGHLPFQADSFSEMCVMVAVEPPAPTTATPRELAPIIARCLAKNPDERYRSVAELACDLACLAREPDKAQAAVDRMYRMLRRGAMRRTPATGVPLIGAATELAQPRPSASVSHLPPSRPSPTGFADALAPIGSMNGMPRMTEASPASGVPVAVAYAGSAPAGGTATPAPPLAIPSPGSVVIGGRVPGTLPPYPGYTYAAPLPMRIHSGSRELRPGFAMPRGAADLATTHVIPRRDRGWTVILLAAVITLAAAIAVILATRTGPVTLRESVERPTVVRMNRMAAPPTASLAAPELRLAGSVSAAAGER